MTRFDQLPRDVQRAEMEKRIRAYFAGCDAGDAEEIASHFTSDGVHYFPPGLKGPWRGNTTIGENWRHLVRTIGSAWTIDRVIAEPESLQAVIEWTHWKTKLGVYVRGDEWYIFDAETGLIKEIRAYYASSPDGRDAVILEGFDYEGENYYMEPQVERPHPEALYN